MHEYNDFLNTVPGLCLPSPSIWSAEKQVLDFVDGILDVDDWDVGLPVAAHSEAEEGKNSGDIDELIIGPVPKPLPLKRPCNLTYAVEWYWMNIRDGLQVTSKGKLFVDGAHSRYQILHGWLIKYAAKYGEVDLFDVNDKWLKGFIHFLHHQNLSLNTVSGYVDNLHAMFGNLATDGYTVAKLTVRVHPEATHFVYNSEEELKFLLNFEFSHEALSIARDIFILQSYTGFRVGTLQIFLQSPQLYLLKDEDGWLIQIRTNKTGRIVTVPVKPIVLDILQRRNYSFEAAYYERYYNTLIKMMAREAGLVKIVPYAMTYGRKRKEFRDEKWELMASHTARRNFATNAFLAGVPVEHIMFVTGHTTREAFMRYIRCEGIAVAKALMKLPFFIN